MTLTPQAEARIDDRIRRLAPRRGAQAGRIELRSHVADAAEALAAGAAATPDHVDAAFRGLGSEADIRAAFFPVRARVAVSRLHVALLALATVLAAVAIVTDESATSSCSVQGPGSCQVSSSGEALELVVWAGPPLVVLAALALATAWVGASLAGIYLAVAVLRAIDSASITGAWDLLVPAAAVITCAVAVRQVLLERRNIQSHANG